MSDNRDHARLSSTSSKVSQFGDQLHKLSQEFDSLGIPGINVNVDVLEQLINSVHMMIQMYRKTIVQQRDLTIKQRLLEKEKTSHQKLAHSYSEKLRTKDTEISLLQESLHKKSSEVQMLMSEKKSAHKEIDALRNVYDNKKKQLVSKISRLQIENSDLRSRVAEDIGKFTSKDKITTELVKRYRAKEQIYEDTIRKLTTNNDELLNQIMNLKEEILMSICKTGSD